MEIELLSAEWKRLLRRRLLSWYDRSARDLPWRKTRDPYRVWLSEVMLQQTQVATVVGYFERFLAEFPTVDDLASADESRVLRLWEGLGYYRRARQLHRAAQTIAADHAGRFPDDRQSVRALPGVGRYTAGAILSIAFDRREPILEANTIRLFARLACDEGDVRSAAGQQRLWSFAEAILPRTRSGALNQALMELGSQICTPKSPDCQRCPVAMLCAARARGRQTAIPRPAKRPKFEDLHEAAVAIRRRGSVVLRRCGEGQRWAGLWDFPRFPLVASKSSEIDSELAEKIHGATGLKARLDRRLATIRHGVTRFRITLDCHEATYLSGRLPKQTTDTLRWAPIASLEDFPLSTTGRKLGRLLQNGQ